MSAHLLKQNESYKKKSKRCKKGLMLVNPAFFGQITSSILDFNASFSVYI